jgi:anthranilate synthase/aminodeoxychorismate synthase-like glutamine amidotransferase
MAMILLIDNYDSFVHNLARYFERLGHATRVVRSDAIDVAGIERLAPAAVVLSPGPCTPDEAGCSLEVVRQLAGKLPILGICLGHQAIGAALGGRVVRASVPMHGRTSDIFHEGQGVFFGLASPMVGCRYHSLVIDPQSLPENLVVTAWSDDGTIMAVEHRKWPVVGLQFHPESILTDAGFELLAAFLRRAGLTVPQVLPTIESERQEPAATQPPLPSAPVTF